MDHSNFSSVDEEKCLRLILFHEDKVVRDVGYFFEILGEVAEEVQLKRVKKLNLV